jgi:NADH dehydrogenase (ubiquinone) 1 beta subcomplex subunit 9
MTAQDLVRETEKLLEKWKHPDPYRPPTAPGGALLIPDTYPGRPRMTILTTLIGSKYERNLPCPILERESSVMMQCLYTNPT